MTGLIKQFLKDVDWGEVDYLVIDTPPGTSDEHLSVVQYLSEAQVDGAVIVTTPQVRVDPLQAILGLVDYANNNTQLSLCNHTFSPRPSVSYYMLYSPH